MIDLLVNGISSIGPFIVTLGLLIFIHELGHFLAARLVGIKVEVFSIGFGKRLFQFTWKDTIFAISAIPLGGYVKLFGDDPEKPVPPEQRHQAFWFKPYRHKILVVLAGPLANLWLAYVIYAITAASGEWHREAILGDIPVESHAYKVGFRPDDHVTMVGNYPIKTIEDFQKALNQLQGQEVTITVQRPGYSEPLSLSTTVESVANPHPVGFPKFIGHIDGITFENIAPVIGVTPGSLAQKLNFQTGDVVESINGQPIQYWRQIELGLVMWQGKMVNWQIKRFNPNSTESETLNMSFELPSYVGTLKSLGLEIPELFIKTVLPNSPAQIAGIQPGDKIIKINQTEITQWKQVLDLVQSASENEPIEITVVRANETKTFLIKPEDMNTTNFWGLREKRRMLGIGSYYQTVAPPEIKIHYGVNALVRAAIRTWETTVMTTLGIIRLVTGNISPRNIGGIITIGQVAHQSFVMGFYFFFQTMALISINLFILNLLPIPVLDGGHVLLFTVEKLKGSPLSIKQIAIIQHLGLAFILSLMGLALFNDITRLLGF